MGKKKKKTKRVAGCSFISNLLPLGENFRFFFSVFQSRAFVVHISHRQGAPAFNCLPICSAVRVCVFLYRVPNGYFQHLASHLCTTIQIEETTDLYGSGLVFCLLVLELHKDPLLGINLKFKQSNVKGPYKVCKQTLYPAHSREYLHLV